MRWSNRAHHVVCMFIHASWLIYCSNRWKLFIIALAKSGKVKFGWGMKSQECDRLETVFKSSNSVWTVKFPWRQLVHAFIELLFNYKPFRYSNFITQSYAQPFIVQSINCIRCELWRREANFLRLFLQTKRFKFICSKSCCQKTAKGWERLIKEWLSSGMHEAFLYFHCEGNS